MRTAAVALTRSKSARFGAAVRRRLSGGLSARPHDRKLSLLQRQLEASMVMMQQHRPLFLSWVVFVQVIVAVCMLSLFPLAKIEVSCAQCLGPSLHQFRSAVETSAVLGSAGFPTAQTREIPANVMIGEYAQCNCLTCTRSSSVGSRVTGRKVQPVHA